MESETQPASVREKVVSELKELAVITAYLYVCFAALIQLKAAVLHAEDVPYAPLGIAAIKAVICAKFMVFGIPPRRTFYKAPAYFFDPLSVIYLPGVVDRPERH